jgi:hypothetical protein
MSISQNTGKSVLTPETEILLKFFACAFCTWTFVKLAGKIRKGRTDEIDNQILRALRKPENPDVPIGPKWRVGRNQGSNWIWVAGLNLEIPRANGLSDFPI